MEAVANEVVSNKFQFDLRRNEHVLIPKDTIPLTKKEWELLEFFTAEQNLQYFKSSKGDTEESLSMNIFRIKLAGDDNILHEGLMNIIGSTKMIEFYREIANNDKLIIDRCQAHLYKENDFISRHIDQESHSGYLYSILLAISEGFTGGEMLLHRESVVDKLTIPYQSILFSDCKTPHEVLPIKSGIRKTIAIFLMEKKLSS